MKTLYSQGVHTLKSLTDSAAMKAENDEYNRIHDEQRLRLQAMVNSGIEAESIYKEACERRSASDSIAEKAFRVCALGAYRSGADLYFSRYKRNPLFCPPSLLS